MVADDHGFGFRVEFGMSRDNGTHWHQHRSGDPADFELPGLAHVKQQRRGGASESMLQLLRRDVSHGQ